MTHQAPIALPRLGVGAAGLDGEGCGRDVESLVYKLLLLIAPLLWLGHIRDSLWLDETITFWVVKDGAWQAVRRALEYQGQSPLYFLTVWLSVAIAGASEWALRLPSLVAFGAATVLVARIGMRLLSAQAGSIAAVVFAYGAFRGIAHDARPYAVAIFFVLASTAALLRWLSSGTTRDAVLYTVMASLVLYSHPLFGLTFAVHLGTVIEYRIRGASVVRTRAVVVSQIVAAVLALPIGIQIAWLWRLRHALWFEPLPSPTYLLAAIAWPVILGGIAWLRRRRSSTSFPVWLVIWGLVPPVVLYLSSITTQVTVAVGRYAYSSMPARALLAAAMINSFRQPVRVALVLCVVAIGLLSIAAGPLEDWRAAVDVARPLVVSDETPVLVRSGLPQALLTDWLEDPERAENVLAPLSFYRIRGRVLALPYDLNAAYIERRIVPAIVHADRFVVLAHDVSIRDGKRIGLKAWFDSRLPGFRSTEVARFNTLVVVVYDRVTAASYRRSLLGPDA